VTTQYPEGWWLASDGNLYPPELHPDRVAAARPPGTDIARAGASAAEEADRLAAAADQQRFEADQWAKGAAGERATAATLANLPMSFVVFHDLHVPGSPANIDHLVIGPTGVFVIDSKAYTGRLTASGDTLWSGRHPIRREVDTINFIAGRVAAHLQIQARPVLCFTAATLPQRRFQMGAVTAVGTTELMTLLSEGPVVLNEAQIGWYARLAGELIEPVALSHQSATDAYELQPTRSPTASATTPRKASRSNGPKRTSGRPGKRKPSALGLLARLALLAVGAVVLLPVAVRSMGDAVTKAARDATTTTTTPDGQLQAGVGVQFICPAPGGWYAAVFVRPPDASPIERFEISVSVNGLELPPRIWNDPAVAPEPVTALAPGTVLEVRTASTLRPGVAPNVQQVSAPPTPC